MKTARTIVDVNAAPWAEVHRDERFTAEVKILTAPDGHKINLLHVNGVVPPHYHLLATSFYMFKGAIELFGQTFHPGAWVIEPRGAIHPQTQVFDGYFGFGMSDGDAGAGIVIVESTDQAPDWAVKLNATIDHATQWIDTMDVPWLPFGDGLSIKVPYVFDKRSAFASLIKAEAGAVLPRRRYLGPADLYVLSGRTQFGDATAGEGCWVHEPAGTDEDVVSFPVATEILANCYGSVIEFDQGGAVSRVIDGFSLRGLAHIRTDATQSHAAPADAEIREQLARLAKASSPRSAFSTAAAR